MKILRLILLAGALVAAPAAASDGNGQDFEAMAVGTTTPWFQPAGDFGPFSGGTVEAPGDTIDDFYQMGGAHVYYGRDLATTNIIDAYSPNGFCCGYFVMEMRVSSRGRVLVEFFGLGEPGPDEDSDGPFLYWPEYLTHSVVLSGPDQLYRWGVEWETPVITSIRWSSLDDMPIAIDDVHGIGFAVIPEPASWALLIAGFGLVGTAMRRHRARTV